MLNTLKTAAAAPEAPLARADRAAQTAAANADSVDREARFPEEAIAVLKAEKLFGILVPAALGGMIASLGKGNSIRGF